MVWTGNLGAAAWNPSKPKEKSLKNWCGREIILQKNRLCAHKNWCGHQIPPLAASLANGPKMTNMAVCVLLRNRFPSLSGSTETRCATRHPFTAIRQTKEDLKRKWKMVFPPPYQLFLILGFILASACAQSSEIVALLERLGASSQSELPLLAWQLLTWS